MRLLSLLMPRERRFFDLFDAHVGFVVEGSTVLADLLRGFDDAGRRDERIARIQQLERQADQVTRDTVALLHKTFVTPLDRDDIHRLISRMDDVLDMIEDAAEALVLYDIQQLTPEACELADLLRECCRNMQQAVGLLSNMDEATRVLALCHEIDSLESRADRVMRAAVSRLFREEADVRQLIKLETIYQLLESATDQCENVANIIEGVVLENA